MYSQKAGQRAKRGSIQIKTSRGWLQLVFTHGGKRHYVSLGIRSNPLNRKLAKDKAFEIERDIEYGEFDATYQKYQVGTTLTTVDPIGELPTFQNNFAWAVEAIDFIGNKREKCPQSLMRQALQPVFD